MNLKYLITDSLGYLIIKIKNPALPIKRKKSDLFFLKEVVQQNTAEVTVSKTMTVVTDSEQWSYAAFLPLKQEKLKKKSLSSSPALILIESVVKRGSIGIGSIKKDLKAFTDEIIRSQKDGKTTFSLLVDPLEECFGLIVRNCCDDNNPSVVDIHSIHVFQLKRLSDNVNVSPPPKLRLAPVKNWNRYYGITPTSMIEKVRLWEYKEFYSPKVMPWIDGLNIKIYPGNEIHQALYLSGLYEPNTMLVLHKLLSPGEVFLDVGANIGCFSLFASRIVGSEGCVFAFEPSSREYKRLNENVQLNKLDNITTQNVAVADTEGKSILNIACEHHSGHNIMGDHFIYDGVESVATEEVETITLNEFVRTKSLDRVDVIKLDIEGGEYNALLGARKVIEKFHPTLIIEVLESALNTRGNSITQLESLLVNNGYKFWEIEDETAELLPISNLTQSLSENIVAIFY